MGEPHKSKLTDYLIEALAKSTPRRGARSSSRPAPSWTLRRGGSFPRGRRGRENRPDTA